MNKREKIMVLIIVGLGVLFAADRFVVTPISEAFANVRAETERLEGKLTEAKAMIRNQDKIERRWSGYRFAGLKEAADAARIRVQANMTDWSQDSRFKLNNLSTGRVVEGEDYNRMAFSLSGVGSLQSIQRFLWAIDTADFPLRINDCSIVSRGDDSDELTLSMNISTIITPDAASNTMVLAEAGR